MFFRNLGSELKQNENISIPIKLSLITYRLGFQSEFVLKNKFLKFIVNIARVFLKSICLLLGQNNIPHKQVFIDWGLRIPHGFFGVFINERVRVGKNCKIFHNVTLGVVERGKVGYAPTIGDNVYIATGSIIIGESVIGNNVKIGAGTKIINRNIPDNSTVVNDLGYKILQHS